jgi:hypothetical protein
MVEPTPQASLSSDRDETLHSTWQQTCARFLRAVAPAQREQVAHLLQQPNNGGSGLREWVSAMAWRRVALPEQIPLDLVDVYLKDPEAVPLFDCESCGLPVPIRPSRLYGLDGDPDEVYFPNCPLCGSRTGLYFHFTHRFEHNVVAALRRRPR